MSLKYFIYTSKLGEFVQTRTYKGHTKADKKVKR